MTLEAGFGQVNITPPAGLSLAGAFAPRPITGVRDPLYASAMVLRSPGVALALVSCDLLELDWETVQCIRWEVQRGCGIRGENVAVFATHTHTGPYTTPLIGHKPDPHYMRTLPEKVARAAVVAAQNLMPADLGVSSAFEEKLSFNRRYVMRDGLVRTHPTRGSPELCHSEGPIDPEIGVLCVRRREGPVMGYFVNFACHPNVTKGNEVSADFPGALSRALRRRSGQDLVTVFANGACGNVCQIDVENPAKADTGPEWADRMGDVLGERVLGATSAMAFAHQVSLGCTTREMSISIRDPDTTPYHGTMFSWTPSAEVDEMYRRQQDSLRRHRLDHPRVAMEIQVMRIGVAALVFVPGELFVELGLELKSRSPVRPTFVVEQANGTVGYIPTEHAFARGGYEVRTSSTSKLVPEAGSDIVATALAALDEL